MNEVTTMPTQAPREQGLPAIFGRLRDEIDQVFNDFTMPRPVRSMFQWPASAAFTPLIELKDRKDRYELAVELPGLEEKDIAIECADGVLSISGEKRSESEEKSGDFLVSERSYGAFRRQLTLPADADADGITAKFQQGVLHVVIKKDQQAVSRVRKIPVG